MKNVKLDRIDKIILEALQENGRATNVECAQKAGISAPPCLRRIRALEKNGYIKGYHAEIAPEKLGFGMIAFIHVSVISHSESDLNNFVKLVDTWPQVRSCYMLSGETDFILRVVSEDWASFQNFVANQLISAPNVAQVVSHPAMRRTNYHAGVPIANDIETSTNED